MFAIAWGRVGDPAAAFAAEGAASAASPWGLGRQTAVVGPGVPALRLCSPGWLDLRPERVAELRDAATLRLYVRRALVGAAPLFARPIAAVLNAYLDRLERDAGPAPTTQEARASVASAADSIFDALLPLPRPWVARLASDRSPELAAFRRHDLGFWDGAALTLVTFRNDPPKDERRTDDVRHIVRPLYGDPVETLDALQRAIAPPPASPVPLGPIRLFANLSPP